MIPEEAAGRLTLRTVCHLVAPRAREPSLNSLGTALRASSHIVVRAGMNMIPRRIDAARIDLPVSMSKLRSRKATRIKTPRKPYTIEGTPAKSSMAGFRIERDRGPASSERYMARGSPTDMFMMRARRVTMIDPTIIGVMPKTFPAECHFIPKRRLMTPTSPKATRLSRIRK